MFEQPASSALAIAAKTTFLAAGSELGNRIDVSSQSACCGIKER
jgi:hypothetical protein